MIRVVIADDHPIVCQGLMQLIATTTDMRVAGCAANRAELLTLSARQEADVLVMDLSMPGIQGLTLLQEVIGLDGIPPIVVLSMHNEGQIVQRAMKLGAAAYVTKESDPRCLLSAIRRAVVGGRYLDPSLLDALATSLSPAQQAPHESLSLREQQVLKLIVSGRQIGDIAALLKLSPKTVSTHKMRIMHKLQVANNADLVRYALRHGIG